MRSRVFLRSLSLREAVAGISPRRATFFSLLAQRKEGKRKGPPFAGPPRADFSALLGLGVSRRTRYAPCGRCAQTAARSQMTKRACARHPKPCAARRLSRAPGNPRQLRWPRINGSLRIVLGEAMRSEPSSSVIQHVCGGPMDRGATSAETCIHTVRPNGERLCFGYFHLARQMKVTRPPGRNPGADEQVRQKYRREAARAERGFDTSA